MREKWFVSQINFKSISGSVEQRAVSGDDGDDDDEEKMCWWRPNTITLIIILWHQSIIFMFLEHESSEDNSSIRLEHIIDRLLLFSAVSQLHMSVYHGKSLSIFHIKVFFICTTREIRGKKKRRKKRMNQDCFNPGRSFDTQYLFFEFECCYSSNGCCPLILHEITSALTSDTVRFPPLWCSERKEREKIKLNKSDCQTSIVRLEVFLLLNTKLLKEWDLCI